MFFLNEAQVSLSGYTGLWVFSNKTVELQTGLVNSLLIIIKIKTDSVFSVWDLNELFLSTPEINIHNMFTLINSL